MSGVSDADGWTWVSLTRSHSEGPRGNRECRDTDTCDGKKDSSGTPLNSFFFFVARHFLQVSSTEH